MVEITKATNFFGKTKKNPASGTRGLVSPVLLYLPLLASIAELVRIIRLKKQP
jgi:hypothetical protein